MTPEFRSIEATSSVDIPAPCFLCGKESHGFAEDGLTGKDICAKCCNTCEVDDETHIDEVDPASGYECDPGEYEPSDDPRCDYYFDPYDGDAYDDGGY